MMKPTKANFLSAQLFILMVTLFSLYPSLSNGWTSWDDNIYVTDNPVITDISIQNVKTVFTRVLDGSYAPLTLISYMIDYKIGGYDPAVYHRTNLLLHLCNACLVFWLAYMLSGNVVAALVTGLLFGIHPMRVESVAWISGRKDVLSMFFFLISSISYLEYLRNPENKKWLTVSFVVFVCALLSKIIVLTFPVILFLYDYSQKRHYTTAMVVEKIPFVLSAGALAFVGYFGQASIHAIKRGSNAAENIIVSLHGVVFYLEKFLFPVRLSNVYPYPLTLTPVFYLYAVLCIAAAFILWRMRKNELVLFGSLFYLVSLLPVLQFIRFSKIFAADRFTYFAYIGLFYIVGVYASAAFGKLNKKIVYTALAAIVFTLAMITRDRCGVWGNNETLWKDMLSKYPEGMQSF